MNKLWLLIFGCLGCSDGQYFTVFWPGNANVAINSIYYNASPVEAGATRTDLFHDCIEIASAVTDGKTTVDFTVTMQGASDAFAVNLDPGKQWTYVRPGPCVYRDKAPMQTTGDVDYTWVWAISCPPAPKSQVDLIHIDSMFRICTK